jgi:IrrE N-terminal-like domain
VPVVRNALVAGVLGRLEQRRIILRRGLSLEQQLSTLVHELTHLIIHCHATPPINRTVCEYEAEAVEHWVCDALKSGAAGADLDAATLTDDLLACSVVRVRRAATTIFGVASGEAPAAIPSSLQPQAAVQVDATAGEEIILHDELHGVRDLIRLTESL